MKKRLHKIALWGSVLLVYGLLVTVVVSRLLALDAGQLPPSILEFSTVASHGQERGQSLINALDQANGISGIWLPSGPNDGRLPGSPALWDEFLRAGNTDPEGMLADSFDGLQVVENIEDFYKGSVAELFLSAHPMQMFRRGNSFFLLNSRGKVQVLDCQDPRQPKLSDSLPYHRVKYMEMQGNTAYLLLSRPGARNDQLVIVDLENPREPRELARLSLPEQTLSFYLSGRRLVVYADSSGLKEEFFIHLYDLADNFQLVPLGKVKSLLLRSGFLKYKDYLLVPGARTGLHVCDFSNPLQPVVVASLATPDNIRRFARHGDMVFALSFQSRIYAIDLHDPVNPVLSTVVEEANYPAYFVEYGPYFYYFTLDGYLRVFDAQLFDSIAESEKWPGGLAGELVSLQAGTGFALLSNIQGMGRSQRMGDARGLLPPPVTAVLTLADKTKVVDTLVWQGFLVVLHDNGLVQFFRKEKESSSVSKESSPVFHESLKLPSAQRWLAASDERLYVGGESAVHVVASNDDGHFVLSGQLEIPDRESLDGLVIQQTLCLAAGKDGLVCFSLDNPDRPKASPGWTIPRHLIAQIDVQQLTSPGGNTVLVAAGSAGLLRGSIDGYGQFQLDGLFGFRAPVRAIAVVGGLCLVSTEAGVAVIDIRNRNSLQNLGVISLQGVERFAVADPDFWAGYVPGEGWSVLPFPHLVLPGEAELFQPHDSTTLSEPFAYRYRLNLFNDHEVVTVPGFQYLSALP
jgi:hypothetical protein